MTNPTKVDKVFWETFSEDNWPVAKEWQEELYNYLVEGLPPGNFHLALYAMDLYGAVVRSHVLNTWPAICGFVKWIVNEAPHESFGSYEKVQNWLRLTKEERTKILEREKLLSTKKK